MYCRVCVVTLVLRDSKRERLLIHLKILLSNGHEGFVRYYSIDCIDPIHDLYNPICGRAIPLHRQRPIHCHQGIVSFHFKAPDSVSLPIMFTPKIIENACEIIASRAI